MNVFPNFGNIDSKITETIKARAGNNLLASQLKSWLRVTSGAGNGLILQSAKPTTFSEVYGGTSQSGMVGVDFDGNPIYSTNSNRGLRPSPIVESINLETGNYGLSRKADFTIKCFTLQQAELVSKYFLEPGYHILVDYGWNLADSVNQSKTLSACEMAKFNSFSHIIEKRKASNGTYDGFMGMVTGGGISLGDDETYNVEVKLVTLGEIPAYLQTHKGAVDKEQTNADKTPNLNTTDLSYTVDELEKADSADDIGETLWIQMFNRLPGHKRTQKIKDLKNEKDRYGNPFKEPGNFINIDDKIREIYTQDLDQIENPDGSTISIPDGVKILSDQSYIRLELAFAIINAYQLNLEPQDSSCSGVKTMNYKIDASWVVIGAHKHIFSTNDKLYVPNENLPDFGLIDLLSQTTEATAKVKLTPPVNGNPFKFYGDKSSLYCFPSKTSLSEDSNYTSNVSAMPDTIELNAPSYRWGYLENLYINFDFFISLLEISNYTAKDIYYAILNAVSEAVNSYWQFEIVEHPDRIVKVDGKNMLKLTISDFNFTGEISANSVSEVASFNMSGTNSPFLNVGVTMDIPGAMASSIMANKLNAETQIEGQNSKLLSLFGGPEDSVAKILNGLKPNPTETTDTSAQQNTQSTTQATGTVYSAEGANDNVFETAWKFGKKLFVGAVGVIVSGVDSVVDAGKEVVLGNEQTRENVKMFANKGVVLPLENNRDNVSTSMWSREKATIDNELFVVGIYNDAVLLKILELGNTEDLEKYNDGGFEEKDNFNSRLLPIEVDFEILGVSGLKVGDLFKISNIPSGFSKPYQIMEVTQQLSSDTWITKVKGKLRNI